jgi:hypothetical protein
MRNAARGSANARDGHSQILSNGVQGTGGHPHFPTHLIRPFHLRPAWRGAKCGNPPVAVQQASAGSDGIPGGARPTRTAAPPPARDLPLPAQALSPSASLRGSVTAPNGLGRAPCAAPHNKTPPPSAAGSHGHQLWLSAPPIHSSLSPTPTSRLSLPIRAGWG